MDSHQTYKTTIKTAPKSSKTIKTVSSKCNNNLHSREGKTSLKEKDFTSVRKWVAENSDTDTTELFRKVYDKSTEFIDSKSIPQLVLILADYQYKAAFVADTEINTTACLTEIMANCEFN